MKEKLNKLINKIDSRIRFLTQTPGYYNNARIEVLEEVQEELIEILKSKSRTDKLKEHIVEESAINDYIGYASLD